MIETVLKENGWGIVSWEGSLLELGTIQAPVTAAPPTTQPTVVVKNMVNQSTASKGLGCGGCLGLIIFFLMFASLIGSCTHH